MLALVSGCGQAPSGRELLVATAANAQPALREIGDRFQLETGVRITLSVASTGTLARQLENGAPFDLLVAADTEHVDALVAQGLLEAGSRRVYAQGRLALVVNQASGLTARSLADLADPAFQRIAIANPQHAPYGAAALEALRTAGLLSVVEERLVWAENVGQALQFVQTGDAAAGIVALSSVQVVDLPRLAYSVLPADSYPSLDQALAVVADSRQPQLARQFAGYVTGPLGRGVLERYGYIVPAGD